MKQWNDERLERIIGILLRTGVTLAAGMVLLGGICYLARHGNEYPNYHVFRGVPAEYRSVRAVLQAMGPSNCRAVIQFGLLVLIATPIARVAFSLAGFALERDHTYIAITAIVLAILLYSVGFEH